jgi:hypothetical protein
MQKNKVLEICTNKMVNGKILAARENQADGKILAALKSLRLLKYRRSWKSRRPVYCLGSAESPTANFSLVLLMSMFCSSLM